MKQWRKYNGIRSYSQRLYTQASRNPLRPIQFGSHFTGAIFK